MNALPAIRIDPKIRDRLAKTCELIASPYDGEATVAARQADKMVRGLGITWTDLVNAAACAFAAPAPDARPPDDAAAIDLCLARETLLRANEIGFLHSIRHSLRHGRSLSAKQRDWLLDIWARVSA